MKDVIRVILIDPLPESRHGLHAMLSASPEFWVADVFNTYENAVRRVLEVNADLVIVAIDADPVAGVRLVQALTHECPRAVTVPASMTRDSSIILQVVRAGAREFLTLPIAHDAFVATVGRLFEGREEAKPEAERGPHIIATAGAAGGVGCTSVAVNLAATLAKTSGHETLLADFDLLLGTVDACLDIVTTRTLLDVTQNIARLDLTLLKRSATQHSSGLYVLPHPAAFEDAAKIDPETLRRVLSLFKSAYATIVIDTSKGLQATDFLAYESADVILVVTQLDLTCLRNT
ncbi:MAG: AAA family ATPase, partial [Planctomycetota bacterium]|nr:AAA family ATPase [Planctomycetota bacterium]